jgi:hypothetical protein
MLQQRRAAIQGRSEPTALKISSPTTKLAPVLRAKASVTALTPRLPIYPYRLHQRQQTANGACNALQRRQYVWNMAYQAIRGCESVIIAIEELNAHYTLKACQQDTKDIPDVVLNFEGIHIRANELRAIERTWILRFNTVREL